MYITTRIKITLLFTCITTILIAILNTLVFETADRDWQEKQKTYVDDVMEGMFTPNEAKSKFTHLEILSSTGLIVSQQGVFASGSIKPKPRSLLFKDAGVFEYNGLLYYIVEEQKDGMILRMAEDFTSVIHTRDMIVEKSMKTSLFGILVIMIIGYFFSGYILRPIRQMNQIAQDFSLEKKDMSFQIDIGGHPQDELVLLARTLESLFIRVQSEASRLEQFSDDIAHEIKNTLFSIQSSLDLTIHTEHREFGIKKAKKLLTELSSVVDALLFFSRNEKLIPVETNIEKLIQSHIDFSDTRIEFIRESKATKISLYPELFITAIGNIISNAQKFTPKDGKITLTLRKDGIEISDTGIGISESDLPHIFDRLFKVDGVRSSGSGYGLGLAIAKKIIQDLHKMSLSVESKEEKGTTFFIQWDAS